MTKHDIYKGLNENQMKAVFATGNTMTIAGAGSGKTKTATVHLGHLIENGVAPESILGVTFTNKAAAEMRERLSLLHPKGANVSMTTFHSLANRFMRKHASMVGRSESFTIYDQANQTGLVRSISKEITFGKLEGSADFYPKKFLTALGNIKDSTIDMEINTELLLEKGMISPAYAFLIDEYEKRLAQNNAMDFADLIRYMAAIIEIMPNTLPSISNMMVDEYQDTNKNQYRIVNAMHESGATVFAVGDLDQTIYTWRGALPENIQAFINDFDAEVIRLEENYRSTPSIISGANKLIENNSMRIEKTMKSVRTDNAPIMQIHVEDMNSEATFVARQCGRILENNADAKIGILYRQNRYSRPIEIGLRRQGIPYYMHKGIDFASRKEVSAALNILRFASNPKDMQTMTYILDRFASGVGEKTINAIAQFYVSHPGISALESTPDDLPISSARRQQFSECMAWIRSFANANPCQIPTMLMERVTLEKLTEFKEDSEQVTMDRQENIRELCRWISEYYIENPDNSLDQFVQEATLDASSSNNPEDSPVHLMTVHSSKGLEFTHVFIVGCADGFFPGAYENEREFEEQRRLFYVAMTRAQDILHMCIPHKTYLGDQPASRFLREIPENTKLVRQF